uniref:Phosducin domain-containing protein n=1 Tax=Chromera velia CCMP2878 TaxID=1169474 RepID=A0A0G4I029_9ALVE|eukprot:Cvel_34237.t1-p1 / transcript=Cvel_34237.t1 / gene=Cvel_34237 / organism=Chromera_velia_CCMP2878 / gene_product=Phosducin-like protein 3, putative / transcript_product=Phosducin-like protein 3, putative / location=Cvel_scaffold5807:471-2717(-) / protein_length=277 / sequence_SO=supercontig / SO=protein_coding / is_pseudo=false
MSTTNPTWQTTEWEDILAKHGVIEKRERPVTEEALTKAAVDVAEEVDVLADKTAEQLDLLEDDIEEDLLESYRRKRIAEMKKKAAEQRFSEIFHIHKDEFVKGVTEASKEGWVVCHLYSEANTDCLQINEALRTLCQKHGKVKFCKGVGSDIIPGYPDRNLPTLLLYKNGACAKQIIGASEYRNLKGRITPATVAWVLHMFKVIPKEDLECSEDPRRAPEEREEEGGSQHRQRGDRFEYSGARLFGRVDRKDQSDDISDDDEKDDRAFSSNRLRHFR